jgi:hypothetical protein
MERKKLFLVLGGVVILLLLVVMAVIAGTLRIVRERAQNAPTEPPEMTLCDVDPSGPCLVSFGANLLDQMTINLRLPGEDYPALYAVVQSREVSSRYPCQAVEGDPTSITCTGPRTPLGEPVDLTIFNAGSGAALSQGTFMVAAIALPSPVNYTAEAGAVTPELVQTATVFAVPQPGRTATLSFLTTPARSATPGTPSFGTTPTPGGSGTPTPTLGFEFPTSTRTLYPTITNTPLNH